MKQVTNLIFLLLLSIAAFTQKGSPSPTLTKEDYLAKSKAKRKVGHILLAGGAGLVLAAFVIPKGEANGTEWGPWGPYESNNNDGIKAAVGLTGTLSMLASIPFFISAGKNKRKAMSISFKNHRVPHLEGNNLMVSTVPSLNVKIKI